MFLTKCLAGGQKFGQGPEPRPCHGLTHRPGDRSQLCTSVGALLSYESTLASLLPSHIEALQFHLNLNQRNWRSKWLTQRGGRRRGAHLHSPWWLLQTYIHMILCVRVCLSLSFKHTHTHTCVFSTDKTARLPETTARRVYAEWSGKEESVRPNF